MARDAAQSRDARLPLRIAPGATMDEPEFDAPSRPSGGVQRLRRDPRVLTVVSARSDVAVHVPLADDVVLLAEHCMAGAADRITQLVEAMIRAGLREEEIAELYVPAAARLMGTWWTDDRVGFADVTVGCASLSRLLRVLDGAAGVRRGSEPQAASVLVMTTLNAQHTLGASVLAQTLRRRGLVTKLWMGAAPRAARQMLRDAAFDAVMISVSSGEPLDQVRRLVEAAKLGHACPPIVIGGSIVGTVEGGAAELRARTGADFVTNDPSEALRLCGLTIVTAAFVRGVTTDSLQLEG